MRMSSTPPFKKPLDSSRAWTCALVNQLAFPGLGTLMAGRKGAGYAQAGLMLGGFFLAAGFALWFMWASMRALTELNWSEARWRAEIGHYAWTGWCGLGLCVVAWFWALVSSVGILREARQPRPPGVPPLIRGS